MKCPECGSDSTVEQLGFDENATRDRSGFIQSNPDLFSYRSKNRRWFFSYSFIKHIHKLSALLVLVFGITLFIGNRYIGVTFIFFTSLLGYLAYRYKKSFENIIEEREGSLVSDLVGKYRCTLDDTVFNKKGKVFDYKDKVSDIKREIREYGVDYGNEGIKFMMISMVFSVLCITSLPALDFPDEKKTRQKNEKIVSRKKKKVLKRK